MPFHPSFSGIPIDDEPGLPSATRASEQDASRTSSFGSFSRSVQSLEFLSNLRRGDKTTNRHSIHAGSASVYSSNAINNATKKLMEKHGPPELQRAVTYSYLLPLPSGNRLPQSFMDKIAANNQDSSFRANGVTQCIHNFMNVLDLKNDDYLNALQSDLNLILYTQTTPLYLFALLETHVKSRMEVYFDIISELGNNGYNAGLQQKDEISVNFGGKVITRSIECFQQLPGAIGTVFTGVRFDHINIDSGGNLFFDLNPSIIEAYLSSNPNSSTPSDQTPEIGNGIIASSSPLDEATASLINDADIFFGDRRNGIFYGFPLHLNGSSLVTNYCFRNISNSLSDFLGGITGSAVVYESSSVDFSAIRSLVSTYLTEGCLLILFHGSKEEVFGLFVGSQMIASSDNQDVLKFSGKGCSIIAANNNSCTICPHRYPAGAEVTISLDHSSKPVMIVGNDLVVAEKMIYYAVDKDSDNCQFQLAPDSTMFEDISSGTAIEGVTIIDFNDSKNGRSFYLSNPYSFSQMKENLLPTVQDFGTISSSIDKSILPHCHHILRERLTFLQQQWTFCMHYCGSFLRDEEVLYLSARDGNFGDILQYTFPGSNNTVATTMETLNSIKDNKFRHWFTCLCKDDFLMSKDWLRDRLLMEPTTRNITDEVLDMFFPLPDNISEITTMELTEDKQQQYSHVSDLMQKFETCRATIASNVMSWKNEENPLQKYNESLVIMGVDFLRSMRLHRYGLTIRPVMQLPPQDVSVDENCSFVKDFFSMYV